MREPLHARRSRQRAPPNEPIDATTSIDAFDRGFRDSSLDGDSPTFALILPNDTAASRLNAAPVAALTSLWGWSGHTLLVADDRVIADDADHNITVFEVANLRYPTPLLAIPLSVRRANPRYVIHGPQIFAVIPDGSIHALSGQRPDPSSGPGLPPQLQAHRISRIAQPLPRLDARDDVRCFSRYDRAAHAYADVQFAIETSTGRMRWTRVLNGLLEQLDFVGDFILSRTRLSCFEQSTLSPAPCAGNTLLQYGHLAEEFVVARGGIAWQVGGHGFDVLDLAGHLLHPNRRSRTRRSRCATRFGAPTMRRACKSTFPPNPSTWGDSCASIPAMAP